jgi:hypothetical protein
MQRKSITLKGNYQGVFDKGYCQECGKPFGIAAHVEQGYTMLYAGAGSKQCAGFFCAAPACQEAASRLEATEETFNYPTKAPSLKNQIAQIEKQLAS